MTQMTQKWKEFKASRCFTYKNPEQLRRLLEKYNDGETYCPSCLNQIYVGQSLYLNMHDGKIYHAGCY